MRAIWRLSTNALARRRLRTTLLATAVALSTALAAAVASSLESVERSMEYRVASHLGSADLQLRHVAKQRFDGAIAGDLAAREGVALVAPRTREAMHLSNTITGTWSGASVRGIVPGVEERMSAFAVDEGRTIEADDEIVLDRSLADGLGVGVGDGVRATADSERWVVLRVVGVMEPRAIQIWNKPQAHMALGRLQELAGVGGEVREINVDLEPGVDPQAFADRLSAEVPRDVMVRLTELVTSRIGGLMQANQIGFAITLALANLGAAVIVLTGLTTGVLERQRELAIVRCVGGRRRQLALAQLATGLIVGVGGAVVGVPLGVALAWIVTVLFPERIPTGLAIWPMGLALSGLGAVGAGVVGGLWPAVTAARTPPLVALAPRARRATGRGVLAFLAVGLAGVGAHVAVITSSADAQQLLVRDLSVGIPSLLIGYVLLGVPALVLVTRLAGPLISAALGLPRGVLAASALSTPYRHGLTAGALMLGLGIMVVVQTNGRAIMRDWVDTMRFPDAFVNGLFGGLDEKKRAQIEALPFVERTSAISLIRVDTDAFGIRGVNTPRTSFIGFDPDEFFEMTEIHWVEGDEDYARRRLNEGDAVVVAQEFIVGREGFGVGDTFPIQHQGETIGFEIVGAVSAPGLDLMSKYFHMEDDYAEQALHAVFGTRADMRRHFGVDTMQLVQIDLNGKISDEAAVRNLRSTLRNPALVVGSGQEIKAELFRVGRGLMTVSSFVAIGAMLVGCAGVANIVVAGIQARRYEFGVLRSVGAGGWLLGRLVVGETLLVALTACLVGTAFGTQASWAQSVAYVLTFGIEFTPRLPIGALSVGWAILVGLTLAAVAPSIVGLATRRPLDLLRATRG
jgi:putative ABC transport system permease protein